MRSNYKCPFSEEISDGLLEAILIVGRGGGIAPPWSSKTDQD